MKPTQCLGVLTLRAGQYSTSVRFFFLLFGYRQCEIWHLAPLRRDPIFIFSSLNCSAVKKYLADAQLSHRQGTAGTSNPPEKRRWKSTLGHAPSWPFFTKFRHLSSIFSSVGLHSPFYKLTASTWKRKMTQSFENALLSASLKLHFHIDIGK